ncbi:uncharacterized protein LOC141903995 [Tubulanus polymorphus]|uniref:uncharacterized protein LOC141903995 n=1 Tax=Tubulanus polymorphus TaxID=672921 RepID=UPI003DA45FA1
MTNSFSVSVPNSNRSTNLKATASKCFKLIKGVKLLSSNDLFYKTRSRCLVMSKQPQQLDVQQPSVTNDGYKRITNPQCVDNCGQNSRGAQLTSTSTNSAAKGLLSHHNHDIPQLCLFDTVAKNSGSDFFRVQTTQDSSSDLLQPVASTSSDSFAGQTCDDDQQQCSPNLLCSFESVVFNVPDVPTSTSETCGDESSTVSTSRGLETDNSVACPPVYIPFTSEQDYSSLKSVMHRLYISGFYYEGLSSKEATELLEGKQNGSFLLRDSSDPNHLFSLSLKTPRGTTSVRIEYHKGKFRLDSEDCLKTRMPTFDCVISLIMYYVKRVQGKSGRRVLLDSTGRRDLPVKITKPVLKCVPMMKHCSRKAICRTLRNPSADVHRLPLPNLLKSYLSQYPYPL